MKAIESENVIFFDVDDTLIIWNPDKWIPKGEAVEVLREVTFTDPWNNAQIKIHVNDNNITLLKEKAQRGYTVVVWSQGGWKYVTAIVEALGLKEHVDFAMTKPNSYVDDLEVTEWMPSRIYLNPYARYKR